MKKCIVWALCALLALSMVACVPTPPLPGLDALEDLSESLGEWGENLGENLGEWGENFGENLGEWGENLGESFGIANPFTDYETLEDAEKAVGFTLTLPAGCGLTEREIQVMDGKLLQIIDDANICFRKQAGDEDISGDYNTYTDVKTIPIGDSTVTIKGSDGLYATAIWTANGYSYAVLLDEPVPQETLTAMIEQIR